MIAGPATRGKTPRGGFAAVDTCLPTGQTARIVRRLAVVLAAVAAAAMCAAPAQAGLEQRLQVQMHALVRAGVPGVVVHVRRGSSTADLAAGRADLAEPRRMTTDDRFKVGSVTKTFVSTAVLQLVAD